uniref:Neuritin-like protein isoform X2 n=1 Tax=Geotrypetes seraphini TaxID=260995 RepID=A0A6P8QRW3_GEOSA|nr:neuritin-like protein isoform X2 [Geotrypetes seraphini]
MGALDHGCSRLLAFIVLLPLHLVYNPVTATSRCDMIYKGFAECLINFGDSLAQSVQQLQEEETEDVEELETICNCNKKLFNMATTRQAKLETAFAAGRTVKCVKHDQMMPSKMPFPAEATDMSDKSDVMAELLSIKQMLKDNANKITELLG